MDDRVKGTTGVLTLEMAKIEELKMLPSKAGFGRYTAGKKLGFAVLKKFMPDRNHTEVETQEPAEIIIHHDDLLPKN